MNDLEVRIYRKSNGDSPFAEFRHGITDIKTRATIDNRLDRLALGNPGDCKPVGEGIHELRIHQGPGYRVYFANDGRQIVVILAGSDKSDQDTTIKQAKKYWKDYQERRETP